MGRSGYSDGCEGWELIMWRGAVASAIRGKRGQEFLTKLLAALDALPEKRLIEGELEADGEVCAIGSVGRLQGIDMSKLDPYEAVDIADSFNISPALVKEIAFVNDEWEWHATPEKRFEVVRKWAESHLATSKQGISGQSDPEAPISGDAS
jgi:hypothetical protein